MNNTLFGMPRTELSAQLKALGLDPDITTIKEMNVEDYNDLRSDDIEAEQSYKIKWHKIKDWGDYIVFHEKEVDDTIDLKTGIHINIIDLYYTVNSLPVTGNGYILVTEDIKELSFEEYLNRYIMQKYTNNPYVELRNIKEV